MKKLTLVVDERELSTIRAALLLLQEQADALPEDLAEMMSEHGQTMTAPEIERLSLDIAERLSQRRTLPIRWLPKRKDLIGEPPDQQTGIAESYNAAFWRDRSQGNG